MRLNRPLVSVLALATLGSGLVNLYSLIAPSLPERTRLLHEMFPLEFIHLSRFLTLLIGFALVVSALNIHKRKKRAYQIVLLISCASVVFHLTKGLDYEEAALSFVLLVLLVLTRNSFSVKSSTPDWKSAAYRLAIAFALAIGYGTAGFWFLDPREFGINFTLGDSIHRTFQFLTFVGDPQIMPRGRYAHWFLDSLQVMSLTAIGYSVFALFRPVFYRFRTLPYERELAYRIVQRYGRSSQDFFKYGPDKSFFFSPSKNCLIAYRVGRNFAVVLGDPVGPESEMEETVRNFREYCRGNDWEHGFHEALPDFLPFYIRLGYRKLKIGDEAIVDVPQFRLEGKERRKFRSKVNQFEEQGLSIAYFAPPIDTSVLQQAKEVSDEWLHIPGHRERSFTVGLFEPDYLRSTPIFAVIAKDGRLLAFVNVIPSFVSGEATIDLMRHRLEAPNGIMDYLFVKLILHIRDKGFTRFSLGMAPMAGFQEHEQATGEERAVHYFMQQLKFLFRFSGLHYFKAKFASSWEPRYAVYQHALDLPRLAIALRSICD